MAWKWLEDAADKVGDVFSGATKQTEGNFSSEQRRAVASRPGLEASKEGQVAETQRKQTETIDYAKQAMQGGAITDPSVKVGLLEKLDAARRQQLAGAAADGVMHSGALGQARRSAAQKQAMGTAALVAEEERAKRERLMQIEQQRAAVQAGIEKIPTNMAADKTLPVETFKAQRELLAKRDNELQGMIAALDKKRHTPEQLQSMFNQEIEGTYNQLTNQAVSEAQRLGMSEQYIQGLQRSFDQDKARAIRDSGQMVAALSGPDPQQASALLESMYRPDLYEAVTQSRQDPALSMILGFAGAGLGGFIGQAPGATAGYNIGTGIGQILG